MTQAFIARIEEVNPRLNALVVRCFDSALEAAVEADAKRGRGETLGPLHGVPITLKECFHLAGTPATIGLEHRRGQISQEDGLLVARVKAAGAIVLGKTNLPQLMVLSESDNPVYGPCNNPWDVTRTSGGSTGGEAALIAAGGSPLGLGNDLGGSIRVPAHFCGIHGLKPTTRRVPREGSVRNFSGLLAIQTQAGPMARRVEDLELLLRRIVRREDSAAGYEVSSAPLRRSRGVDVAKLRIGWFTDDGFFPPSRAIVRATEDAAAALQAHGAEIIPFKPREHAELVECYVSLLAADGGANLRRLAAGNSLDWRVSRMLLLERLPLVLRLPLVGLLRIAGQHFTARMVGFARPRSVDNEWRLIGRAKELCARVAARMDELRLDALLCPPFGLPAFKHQASIDLLSAGSYAFVPNILGYPAGTVSLTRVRADEEGGRNSGLDAAKRQAVETDRGSCGLPVGVQVVGRPFREDVVLAVMRALEQAFEKNADYPPASVVPAG